MESINKDNMYYNSWKYIYGIYPLFFDVIPCPERPTPDSLYKYYSLSANSIDALTQSYIYVSHPNELNDVFDSSEHLLKYDNENVNGIMDGIISNVDNPNNNVLTYSKSNHEILYSKIGIFSMTDKFDSILMWAYYTNNKGFAIEFDIEKLKESTDNKTHGPFPINYIEKLEQISLKKYSMSCAFLMQSNIKDIQWEHEHEWRLIVESENGENFKHPTLDIPLACERKSLYQIEAIKSIYLGRNFFEKTELSIIDSKNWHVRLIKQIEQKSDILTFLIQNKIRTYFWKQNKLELNRIECVIEQECNCCFRIEIQE